MPSGTEPAIEVAQLSRRYADRWALAGVNLRLSAGRSLLVAGHNGAGKTTLLRLLATSLRPTEGQIRIGGHDAVADPLQARRAVAMLGQYNGLYHQLTAMENLRIAERLLGLPPDPDRLPRLLERVGLTGREHEVVRGFSAGMRKRVAVARLLLKDAPVVLLDEPYGQLDPEGFAAVDGWVVDLLARGRAVIMVTHLVERAAALLHAGMVLQGGRMQWVGPASEVPAHIEDGS